MVPPNPTLHQHSCGIRQMTGTSSCDEAKAKLGPLSEPQNRSAIHDPGSYEADKSGCTRLNESSLVRKVAP